MPGSVCLSMIWGNSLGRSLLPSSNSLWCICFTDPRGSHRKPSADEPQCRALSPDFPAGLYPLARVCRIPPALGMAPALLVCWIEGGAGFFLFAVWPGGDVEPPGRSRPAPGGVELRRGGLNVELSLPIFRLDFIPWRGSAGFH